MFNLMEYILKKNHMKKFVFLTMLFGLMTIIPDSASAQNLCSKDLDGRQVYIEIANVTNKAFAVNLVDKNCKEFSSNQQVPPGEIFSQILTNGDAFRVREAGTNKLLQEIVVNPSKPIIFIETDLAGSNPSVRYLDSDNDFKKRAEAAFASSKPQTPVAQSPSPVAATKSLIPAGTDLKKGVKYPSSSGNHYLILQNDGNLIVKTKNDGYVWGLDQLKKNSADRVELGQDGSLVAYDKQCKAIWSPQAKRDPNAKLNVTFNGALQMVAGNGEILWSSDGNLSPTIMVFAMKPNVKPCAPEPGWAKCIELADPTIQIMGTSAVSQSAINGVANVYTEITKRFGAKYPKSKFNGFKIYMTNGEPWSALSKLSAINLPQYVGQRYEMTGDFLRGFGGPDALWITEQMLCKEGVKTRNADGRVKDNTPRTFDQVVHEFGHSIDFKYIPDQTLNMFRISNLTSVESFPYTIQFWFGTPGGTIPANQEAILKELFTSRATFSCEGYKP